MEELVKEEKRGGCRELISIQNFILDESWTVKSLYIRQILR